MVDRNSSDNSNEPQFEQWEVVEYIATAEGAEPDAGGAAQSDAHGGDETPAEVLDAADQVDVAAAEAIAEDPAHREGDAADTIPDAEVAQGAGRRDGTADEAGATNESAPRGDKDAGGVKDVEADAPAEAAVAENVSGDAPAEAAGDATAEDAVAEHAAGDAPTEAVGTEHATVDAPAGDASTEHAPADSSAPETPARDARIPEVITARTLFFLAPDLPPMPEPQSRSERSGSEPDEDDERRRGRGRSRRGRRSGGQQQDQPRREAQDEPGDEPELITEPQKVHGSTRLAAKRQRRRDGRDIGRRRTVVTESEFQARREAVDRKMLVRARNGKVQIGVLEDNVLVEHYVARNEESSLIGNVYLGRVQNVLPSMEAAFVDIGRARNAVLYSGEVDWSAADLGPNQPRKIENALKPGDKVLVQVTKDPIGHKGARLTSQISLPGRYLVYVPGNTMNGISRKLPDTERSRLKKILKEVLPAGVGVIVRTAAEGATKEQLELDVERLTRQWDDIQKRAKQGRAPQTLHAEPDMLIKIIRDVFNEDFQKLIIQGQSELDTIKHYLGQVAPDLLDRVERYEGRGDMFQDFRVNDMIDKALSRKVWLPSGGSLVIDRTEAMTVVDVNTGKFVGSGGNLEETVTKNNLEAAEEVVRQLRLRDIGGIIVIDFIDMVLEENRDLVQRRLVECLSRDRTKHQVAEVTSLGLIQMTRKKIGLGLLETFSEACETCDGRGVIVHGEPLDQGSGVAKGGRQRRNRDRQEQKQKPQPKPQNGGTHEITDDARNALTKIAASTIVSAKADDQAALEGAASRLAIAAAAAVQGESPEQAIADADLENANQSGSARGESSTAEDAGEGSRRSRRGRRGRGRNRRGDDGNGSESTQSDSSNREDAGERSGSNGRGTADGTPGRTDDRADSTDRADDSTARGASQDSRRARDDAAPASSDDDAAERASAAVAAALDATAQRKDSGASDEPAASGRKERRGRRRVSTDTVELEPIAVESSSESEDRAERVASITLDLPAASRADSSAQAEPAASSDAAPSLGDLSAALDSLAATPPQERTTSRKRAPRRRITTGPISNAGGEPTTETE